MSSEEPHTQQQNDSASPPREEEEPATTTTDNQNDEPANDASAEPPKDDTGKDAQAAEENQQSAEDQPPAQTEESEQEGSGQEAKKPTEENETGAEAEPAGKDANPEPAQENTAAASDEPANTRRDDEEPPAEEKQPEEPSRKNSSADKPEAKSNSNDNGDADSPYRHMTREQFIQCMGLAEDVDPPASSNDLAVRGVDIDGDGIDDYFIRNTDLSEPLMAAANAAPVAENSEYRKKELQTFKTRHTSTRTTASGDAGAPPEDDDSPLRHRGQSEAKHDAEVFRDYRAKNLDEFRQRKACGQAKTPTKVSTAADDDGAATAA